MSLFEQLKNKNLEAMGQEFSYKVPVWDLEIKLKKLSNGDQDKARSWAERTYRGDKEKMTTAQGVAIICLSVKEDIFPLSKETVDLFLDESTPIEITTGILKKISELNGINLGVQG